MPAARKLTGLLEASERKNALSSAKKEQQNSIISTIAVAQGFSY